MKNQISNSNFNLMRVVKKFFLSAFVVVSFVLYALQRPGNDKLGQAAPVTGGPAPAQTDTPAADTPSGATATPESATATAPTANDPSATSTPEAAQPVIAPTDTAPAATATPAVAAKNGQYRDGTYTGPEVDAQYGLVQVQTVIQNGKISNVQFLEYPNDRRTSVRINSYAVPYLQQEAVQAQSANVNLVTGATLTSEAFQMSLQAALDKAK